MRTLSDRLLQFIVQFVEASRLDFLNAFLYATFDLNFMELFARLGTVRFGGRESAVDFRIILFEA